MLTNQSTAGRELTHPTETNDCTVVALAHAMSIPYAEAHAICAAAGRRPKDGLRNFEIANMLRKLEKDGKISKLVVADIPSHRPAGRCTIVSSAYNRFVRRPRRVGTTVAQFIRTLPKTGRFYLTCTSHAFAYVDGKVLDNLYRSKARALMTMCCKIELPEAKPELAQSDISAMWERLNRLEGKL